MSWNPGLFKLRDLLAVLYPTVDDSRVVVEEAGIQSGLIAFDVAAVSNWFNILTLADSRGQVADLIGVACQDYPERCDELRQAEAEYHSPTDRMTDPSVRPGEWVIEIDRDVPPGGTLELTEIELQAPQAPGRYEVSWVVQGQDWERQGPPVAFARQLEVRPEFAKARPHLLVRQAGGINLRMLPQPDSEVVAQVANGTLLEVRGDLERALANLGQAGEAIYVQAPDGTVGYVDAGLVAQRGAPRLEYERNYVLLPPGSDLEWALAVVDATWADQRVSFGTSVDDAGIGAVAKRDVYAVNPQQWSEDPVDVIARFYPGVELVQLTLQTPEELRERLPQLGGVVSSGLPTPLEERDRAYANLPREQYRRTYVLLPPGAEAEWARAAVRATWGRDPLTIGSSADDAGIGDLDVRQVLAINPGAWGDVPLGTFYEQNYPGVDLVEIQADRPQELAYRLEEVEVGFWPTTRTLERLSTATQAALRWAEGLRQKAGSRDIYTEYLLAGLYHRERTTTHRLLTLFDDETTIEDLLERLANQAVGTSLRLADVEPAQALPEPLALSQNTKKALLQAAVLADEQDSATIRARHMLAGLLAVRHGVAGPWIARRLGVKREQLYELVAQARDTEVDLDAVRQRSTRGPYGETLLWFNGVNASTGQYLLPPMSAQDVARIAQGEVPGEELMRELRAAYGLGTGER